MVRQGSGENMVAVQGFVVGGRRRNMTLPRQETQVHGILHPWRRVSFAAAGNRNAHHLNLGVVQHKKNRRPIVNGNIGVDYPFLGGGFNGSDGWLANLPRTASPRQKEDR